MHISMALGCVICICSHSFGVGLGLAAFFCFVLFFSVFYPFLLWRDRARGSVSSFRISVAIATMIPNLFDLFTLYMDFSYDYFGSLSSTEYDYLRPLL